MKRKVFHACFVASITYGCESWISPGNLKPVEALYHGATKALLSVRSSTCHDLCLNELGLPNLSDSVKQRQANFFDKMAKSERSPAVDPFAYVMHLIRSYNTESSRLIGSMPNLDIIAISRRNMKDMIRNSNKSKVKTYLKLSPTLEVPPLYLLDIPEYVRALVTRFRLSAHNLKVETGRWARIPRHERVCTCGTDVQDEFHVIEDCTLIAEVRNKYTDIQFDCISLCICDTPSKAWAIHDIVETFK